MLALGIAAVAIYSRQILMPINASRNKQLYQEPVYLTLVGIPNSLGM